MDVFVHIKAERSRSSRLIQNLRTLINTINAMATYRLVFIGETDHVLEISVPYQRIRAEGIGLAAMMEYPFLFHVIFNLLESDLTPLVDGVDGHKDLLIF